MVARAIEENGYKIIGESPLVGKQSPTRPNN
jgi:hypothetical protein